MRSTLFLLGLLSALLSCNDVERAAIQRATVCGLFPSQHGTDVPAFKEGRGIGLKLFGVHPESARALLGLQNGDIVVAINGLALSSTSSSFEDLQKAIGDCSSIDVEIIRNGMSVHLGSQRAD